jgi:large subunit ribosomal protein L9
MAKVILTQEVSGLGEPGDVVDVKDGYARNYLVPRALAMPWTKGAEKQVTTMRKARKARELASVEDALAAKEALAAKVITVRVRAGAGGRLFGTVTPKDIAEAVKEAGGPVLDRHKIQIGPRIKTTGEYTVNVRLHESVDAQIPIVVAEA